MPDGMNHGSGERPPPAALIAALRGAALRDGQWRPVELTKGASIDWRGERGSRLIIVESGLVKLSYLSADGDERIKSFIVDEGLFGGFDAGSELAYDAVCLEPSRIVGLATAWVRQALADDPSAQRAVSAFWSWLSGRKRDRENALLCLSPARRYAALRAREPALLDRLSQGDIARYLGVTPVAFSRIKRRLRGAAAGHAAGVTTDRS